MKKLMSIIFACLIFSSCAVIDTVEKSRELIIIDYGKYAAKGFLFTPYIYNGDFEPVGPVEYTYSPGAVFKTRERSDTIRYYSSSNMKVWHVENFNLYDAMDDVYNACLAMGADALVETRISGDARTVPSAYPVTIPVYKISGFAIKRK